MVNGNACFAYFNKIWGILCDATDRLYPVLVRKRNDN